MDHNTIVIGRLYRFGYDLEVVGRTEAAVRKALVREYNRAYKEINGTKPTSDEIRRRNEDIEIHIMTIGQVEWN